MFHLYRLLEEAPAALLSSQTHSFCPWQQTAGETEPLKA